MHCLFYPLGGLFHILVYTRPKVLSLRRKNPHQYSFWFQDFVIVIRAGAVVPIVVVEEEIVVYHCLVNRRVFCGQLDNHQDNLSAQVACFVTLARLKKLHQSSFQIFYRRVSSVVTLKNRTIEIKMWTASTMEIIGYWILRLQVLQMHYHRQMSPTVVLQRMRVNGQIYRYFQEWTAIAEEPEE